jgi:hypothetical protein
MYIYSTMAPTKDKKDGARVDHPEEDDTIYPPFKIVLPAMVAVWLVFFVVALVNSTPTVTST